MRFVHAQLSHEIALTNPSDKTVITALQLEGIQLKLDRSGILLHYQTSAMLQHSKYWLQWSAVGDTKFVV